MIADIVFTHDPIVIPPVALSSREIGSVLEFHGVVRELEEGAALSGLYYEAYESMARKRLDYHIAELQREHPVAALLFIHRLGWVPVGESSLYVRVASSHRAEGLRFLAELVVRLKRDVPVWKLTKQPG